MTVASRGWNCHFCDANSFTTNKKIPCNGWAEPDIGRSDRMTIPLKFDGSYVLKRSGHEPVFAY